MGEFLHVKQEFVCKSLKKSRRDWRKSAGTCMSHALFSSICNHQMSSLGWYSPSSSLASRAELLFRWQRRYSLETRALSAWTISLSFQFHDRYRPGKIIDPTADSVNDTIDFQVRYCVFFSGQRRLLSPCETCAPSDHQLRRVQVHIWTYDSESIVFRWRGNIWALLRKFFSVFCPPLPLTICSSVESLKTYSRP